jgi:hypothetical protein
VNPPLRLGKARKAVSAGPVEDPVVEQLIALVSQLDGEAKAAVLNLVKTFVAFAQESVREEGNA